MRDTYWSLGESLALAAPAAALNWAQQAQAAPLPGGIRALFARLGARRPEPPRGEQDDERDGEAGPAALSGASQGLRAQAQAAFRTVDGDADRGLELALGVMEAEIGRLRRVAEEYGEALKTIEVYGADAAARGIAASARRAAPCALRAAPPVPRSKALKSG